MASTVVSQWCVVLFYLQARRCIVNLSWNVRSAGRGRTSYQTLAMIVEHGGLPSWTQAVGIVENAEQMRRALWALATWLTVDDRSNKLNVVRNNGLVPLLKVDDTNANAEMNRYARLALSKLLCAVGDELTMRVQLLRSQLDSGHDLNAMWEDICDGSFSPCPGAHYRPSCIAHAHTSTAPTG